MVVCVYVLELNSHNQKHTLGVGGLCVRFNVAFVLLTLTVSLLAQEKCSCTMYTYMYMLMYTAAGTF